MTRTRERRSARGKIATVKLRPLKETLEWIRTTYVEALKRRGLSARRHAALLGVHHDTTADWKSGATPVNVAQVLRDDELAYEFVRCVHVHVMRAKRRNRRSR